MDRDLWILLCEKLNQCVRRCNRIYGKEKRVQVSTRQVVLMYCWQVYHQRTLCSASDRASYSGCFRPRKLLSVSQYTRRVKSVRTQQLLQMLHEQTAGCEQLSNVSYFDGKLLPVALHSKDKQATKVRTNGGYVRGYRLHAWARENGKIGVWCVTGANAAEQTVARELVPRLPMLGHNALVLGDIRFDSADLYRDVAARGAQLLTPLIGITQDKKKRNQMGVRIEAVIAWEKHSPLARMLLRQRTEIERIFGRLVCTTGGLSPLPAWVRTLPRVRRWVGVKIIFHNIRVDLAVKRKAA